MRAARKAFSCSQAVQNCLELTANKNRHHPKRGGLLLGYNFVCEPFSVSGYSMFDSIFLFCGSGGSG